MKILFFVIFVFISIADGARIARDDTHDDGDFFGDWMQSFDGLLESLMEGFSNLTYTVADSYENFDMLNETLSGTIHKINEKFIVPFLPRLNSRRSQNLIKILYFDPNTIRSDIRDRQDRQNR